MTQKPTWENLQTNGKIHTQWKNQQGNLMRAEIKICSNYLVWIRCMGKCWGEIIEPIREM
jgi:hypothetical protein